MEPSIVPDVPINSPTRATLRNIMDIQRALDDHNLILMEAAVIESLRRAGKVLLHPHLENALLLYSEPGRTALKTLYQRYIGVAHDHDLPVVISGALTRNAFQTSTFLKM